MRKTYWMAALALALLAGLAAWAYFSPVLTVRAMAAAADANDSDRLSSYIDYDALRRDLKAELSARLEAEARKQSGPGAGLGLAVGRAMVGPMVDAMVSPRGLKTAFAAIARGEGGKAKAGPRPAIDRDGLGRFRLSNPAAPDSALVFERRGLGWKLVGIELPEPAPAR
jgi:hypothetical protein